MTAQHPTQRSNSLESIASASTHPHSKPNPLQIMLQSIAAGSRANGTSYGYGTWGLNVADHRTSNQIASDHELGKLAAKASLNGDYDKYNQLLAQMSINQR